MNYSGGMNERVNSRSIRTRHPFLFASVLFILLGAAVSGQRAADRSDQLHVFVFEDRTGADPHPGEYDVRPLNDALLPLHVSRAAVNTSGDDLEELPGLPAKVGYLDVHTIRVSDAFNRSAGRARRSNPFSRLDYQLHFVDWQEDSYLIDLNASYRGQTWAIEGLALDPSVTTVVRLGGEVPVGLALTRLDRVGYPVGDPLSKDIDRSRVTPPVILKHGEPKMPRRPRISNHEEVMQVLTCIDRRGRIRSSDFILLDCSHPSYAKAALENFVTEWLFEPGRVAGEAIAVNATLEVVFRLEM